MIPFTELVDPLAVAAITKCWFAREVYGHSNPKCRLFRAWLENDAPRWFHDLYFRYGERFAGWLKGKPRLMWTICKWMDSRIRHSRRRAAYWPRPISTLCSA